MRNSTTYYAEPEVTFTFGSYVAEQTERYITEKKKHKRKAAEQAGDISEYGDATTDSLVEDMKHVIRILGRPGTTYKDRVFRMLLKDRKVALEVYNAMNGSNYTNPDELEFTTLENAVYMGMKTDIL